MPTKNGQQRDEVGHLKPTGSQNMPSKSVIQPSSRYHIMPSTDTQKKDIEKRKTNHELKYILKLKIHPLYRENRV